MRVDQALAQTATQLHNKGVESPRLDAELLLAHVLGVNRAAILTWPQRQLTPKQLTRYRGLVGRQFQGNAAHRPILVGTALIEGLFHIVQVDHVAALDR